MAFAPELTSVHPDSQTEPFWQACRRRELRFQRCESCHRFRHPPLPGCPHCGGTAVAWVAVNGRGRIFSYTIVHHPTVPALAAYVPYNVIVVEFDDAPGVRLISNLIDTAGAGPAIGAELMLVWDEVASDLVLPRFRLAAADRRAGAPAPRT